MPGPRKPTALADVDTGFLEGLVGYNTRRASLAIAETFVARMAVHGLSMVEFSCVSLTGRNPGITARQLSAALAIQPPNMVAIIGALEKRDILQRKPHPTDGRAACLELTRSGQALAEKAESTAMQLEIDATRRLSPRERRSLIASLQKIYK